MRPVDQRWGKRRSRIHDLQPSGEPMSVVETMPWAPGLTAQEVAELLRRTIEEMDTALFSRIAGDAVLALAPELGADVTHAAEEVKLQHTLLSRPSTSLLRRARKAPVAEIASVLTALPNHRGDFAATQDSWRSYCLQYIQESLTTEKPNVTVDILRHSLVLFPDLRTELTLPEDLGVRAREELLADTETHAIAGADWASVLLVYPELRRLGVPASVVAEAEAKANTYARDPDVAKTLFAFPQLATLRVLKAHHAEIDPAGNTQIVDIGMGLPEAPLLPLRELN